MTSEPGHLHRIGRGGSLNLMAAAVAAGMGIALSVVVARSFSEEDTGLYFAATSVALLGASMTRLGTSIGLVYWVARLREHGHGDQIRNLLGVALKPVLLLSTLGGVLLFVSAPWLSDVLLDGSDTGTAMLRVLAFVLPAIVSFDALVGCTRGMGSMIPTATFDKVTRPTLQLVLVAIAALSGSVVAATAAWALPYVVVVAVVGVWVARRTRSSPVDRSLDLRRSFWTFTWPRAITSIVQQARQRFDIVLVSAIQGPAEAALYAVATRFLVVGQLTNSALALAAQPQVARLSVSERHDAIAGVYRSTTTWIITMNGPLYLGIAIFSPLLLSIFGETYVSAWPVTVTLCIAAFFGNASGMVDVMLSMTGRTSVTLANSLGALATQVVLIVLLVPTWGAFGAAIAWGTSILVINGLSITHLARTDGIHPFEVGTGLAIAANLVGVALPAGLVAWWFGQTWGALVIAILVCTATYAVIAWLLRSRLHLAELAAALRRGGRHRG